VIVLDTHVWLWWTEGGDRLAPGARHRIDSESDRRVSAISLLEIATACARGRLLLRPTPEQWLAQAQRAQGLQIEPLTPHLCIASTTLPGEFHRDPGDRLIVALARHLDCELFTSDHQILAYPHVRAVAASK
jgi:PIN domain nuclease of toxin-antitoxin system